MASAATGVTRSLTEQQPTTMASAAAGVTKKYIRSRGRAKRAQDPYASAYGRVSWQMFRQRPWIHAGKLDEATVGKYVLVFGSVYSVRPLSKTSAIVVLLNQTETVRCMIVASAEDGITTRMVRFAATMRKGTYIDVEGVVSLPVSGKHIRGTTTQQVVIQVRKLHTIGTRQDGSRLGAASQNSSISITSRPSNMLEDKPGQQPTTMASATIGITKKHIRSRGRAKRAQDPYASVYGRVSWHMFRQRPWIHAGKLDEGTVGKYVLVFGSVYSVRPLSKTSTIVVLLNQTETVRCMIVASAEEGITTQMVRFAATMRKGTYIDVEGVVSLPGSGKHILSTTQQVVIQVRKLHTIGTRQDGSRLEAASQNSSISITSRRSNMLKDKPMGREEELRRAGKNNFSAIPDTTAGRRLAHVDKRTSLNYINVYSLVHHAIFRIHSEVEYRIMDFLRSKHFVGIHTHGMFAGSIEGGLAVLKPEDITGRQTRLAQSPWLYKQMATYGVKRVFEIGLLSRHEKSNCKMHMCEFVDLSAEMEIKKHYLEVCDIIHGLLVDLFKHLNKNCKKELKIINNLYQCEPLKYLEEALMLKYDEGIWMLKEAGMEVEHMGDLTNENEQKLGQLVREKYGTDVFILYEHPSALRPLHTMPCVGNPAYSNSFDVFFRGEQIISGSQRIHGREFFMKRAAEFGIDVDHMINYLEFSRYGLPCHAGFGACLYKVVMLFCGLDHF